MTDTKTNDYFKVVDGWTITVSHRNEATIRERGVPEELGLSPEQAERAIEKEIAEARDEGQFGWWVAVYDHDPHTHNLSIEPHFYSGDPEPRSGAIAPPYATEGEAWAVGHTAVHFLEMAEKARQQDEQRWREMADKSPADQHKDMKAFLGKEA